MAPSTTCTTTAAVTAASYAKLRATLLNESGQVPLHERFRALFVLKNVGTVEAVEVIGEALADPSAGALLKHELAYVLGQIKSTHALPFLRRTLHDRTQDDMVRHEAAEAMGAIGCQSSLEVLVEFRDDEGEVECVRETCELAVQRIEYERREMKDDGEVLTMSDTNNCTNKMTTTVYTTVDPAPPLPNDAALSTADLERILLDPTLPLFQRYGAMFSLRNRGGKEAVRALARGFHDRSALFRHEVAYVFGQMQDVESVEALKEVLADEQESPMVRHEAAEALGSIATDDCLPTLERYRHDPARVVSESCVVALDMYEHEQKGEFQYANTLAGEQ